MVRILMYPIEKNYVFKHICIAKNINFACLKIKVNKKEYFMRKTIYVLLLLVFAVQGFAVPASPYPIKVMQSDGNTLTILKCGDEWFHYSSTEDGYPLVLNAKGDYEYAILRNNVLVSTGVVAHQNRSTEERAFLKKMDSERIYSEAEAAARVAIRQKLGDTEHHRAPNPLFGKRKGLVILVNFKDVKFKSSTAKADFTALLNERGYSKNGATGSANDYFRASTFEKFDPEFVVYGPYDLPENMSYYGGNTSEPGTDKNPRQMVIDACNAADNDVDFSEFDTDNDGSVDMVFVYYAGLNEAETSQDDAIWPHKWALGTKAISKDGKRINVYACTSELNYQGIMCGIGTFSHEFGHVLGLPDYYNTENPNAFTVGDWDIMTSGSYNNAGRTPPTWLAHERFYLGYLTPEILNGKTGDHTLEPIVTTNKAYIITTTGTHNLNGGDPDPKYYYMFENKQRVGWEEKGYSTGGAGRLGHGLLVTRVNFNKYLWDSNKPNNTPGNLRFDVIEADGTPQSYLGDTYPGTSKKTVFVPQTSDKKPYPKVTIKNIAENGKNVTFRYDDATGISETITDSEANAGQLTVSVNNDLSVTVILKDINDANIAATAGVFVYSVDGHLVGKYKATPGATSVTIGDLQKGATYIVSLGGNGKNKFAKIVL